MGLENLALAKTDNLPIKHEGDVHNGKVRAVYWFTLQDSQNIITSRNYQDSAGADIPINSQLGAMIISDRISAFDVNWQGEEGLQGVPGKGAALNSISKYWFEQFKASRLAGNHILETPHPLVWIVQRAEPISVEAVGREYIAGSMWRDYAKGARTFCGITLPDGLSEHQKLPGIYITPTTKGTLRGIPGIPEEEDVNITRQQILDNFAAFGFASQPDVERYERLLINGFELIRAKSAELGQIFVDTKFEFGYVKRGRGREMVYIDEVGTPDSSRFWDAGAYSQGRVVENSKEGFRQFLIQTFGKDMMTMKDTMSKRKEIARDYRVPVRTMMDVSRVYADIAKLITGKEAPKIQDARQEIIETLSNYGVV